MAYRVVNEVDTAAMDDRIDKKDGTGSGSLKGSNVSVAGNANTNWNGNGKKMDEDEERDAVFFRLEMLGYRVGQGLVERCVCLLCISFHPLNMILLYQKYRIYCQQGPL